LFICSVAVRSRSYIYNPRVNSTVFYSLNPSKQPLQNNLHELWALLNFLLPDVFSGLFNLFFVHSLCANMICCSMSILFSACAWNRRGAIWWVVQSGNWRRI